jgi:phage baseplate assembly protein V
MLKFALVLQVDPVLHRAKVRFPELDVQVEADDPGIESDWLPVLAAWSVGNRGFSLPKEGEQVACLMDEDLQLGVVLGGVYNAEDTPPAAPPQALYYEAEDGTVISYDPEGHVLNADVQGTATVAATGLVTLQSDLKVKLEAPALEFQGPATFKSPVHFEQNITQAAGKNNPAHHTHPVVGGTAERVE